MMTSGNDFHGDEPTQRVLLAATLSPHRSLNRAGFLAVMLFLSAVSFATGIVFLLMGAWPVTGFFGLDVLLVYFAFRINFRRAGAREEIQVSYAEIRVRRVSHRGDAMEWTFNPLWVRIDLEEHEEFGLQHIYLSSRGARISLGRFLGADQKQKFYNVLAPAVREARRGPTYNPIG